MKQIKHFIWDFDGTLFDTYPVMVESFRIALEQFGYQADPLEIMEKMLQTVGYAIEFYGDKYGIQKEQLLAAYQSYYTNVNENLFALPMEGVAEALTAIIRNGGKNYIFTHRDRESTEDYLEKYGMSACFEEIVCPDTPGFAWKPAPDGIIVLLEKYKIECSQAAMVGDREIDLESGRNAGIKTIHYLCRKVPQKLTCDWRLESYIDFVQVLA